MNLFVILGDWAVINEVQSTTDRVVIGLLFDNHSTANYELARGGLGPNIQCYLVKRPGSNTSGLTDDMKSVYLSDNTTIEVATLMKLINCVTFNPSTGVLSKYPDIPNLNNYNVPVIIPTDIPMAFKRANTVVNLGRL